MNSFDKWIQKKIWKDYLELGWNIRFDDFDTMAFAWCRHNTKTTLVTDLVKSWHMSEKKAKLYAHYIVGYVEDKEASK